MCIVDFFNHPFFIIIGGISTIMMIAGFGYVLFLIIKNILPIWYRLGIGLAKRRIAIFANNRFDEFKALLIDSKIFEEKNIIKINSGDIQKAAKETIFLVYWEDFSNQIDEILALVKDDTALIVYAEPKKINEDSMKKINTHRNAVVVNFKGRLLNDIFTTMITSNF